MPAPVVYASDIDDNRRWLDLPVRSGDIVVSTRSKHGTTWVQMICASLVFGGHRLPEPLAVLSPWVDWLPEPWEELVDRLEAQRHRRLLKTHTPLDGLPLDDRATYVVVARHPLDAAVSLYHQGDNIDRGRVADLLRRPPPAAAGPRPPPAEWLRQWAQDESTAHQWLESPRGVLHHVTDAWERTPGQGPRVVLVHYADLVADLAGQVRRLAAELDIAVTDDLVQRVVGLSGFEAMRSRARELAPDPGTVFKDRTAFFRAGPRASGRDLLTTAEQADFERRCRQVAPAEVVAWLLR